MDRSRMNNVERAAEWATADQILAAMQADEAADVAAHADLYDEDPYYGSDAHYEQVMSDRYAAWNPDPDLGYY